MAVKLQIRRGTKAQLDTLMAGATPLAEGEMGYTTDTQELFISDGSSVRLIGGVTVDITSNQPAAGVLGRYFYASDTDILYLDTGLAWQSIGGSGGSIDGGSFT
jgi:hypothetical protein